MATAELALRKLREICAALPDTDETTHAGSPAFRVRKKMFVTCNTKTGTCRFVFQLEPAHADALVDADPRFERYQRAKEARLMPETILKLAGDDREHQIAMLRKHGYIT